MLEEILLLLPVHYLITVCCAIPPVNISGNHIPMQEIYRLLWNNHHHGLKLIEGCETRTMGKYGQLLEYISYFEDDSIKFYKWEGGEEEDGARQLGYPVYDEGIEKFVEDVYKSDLMRQDYIEYLKPYQAKMANPNNLIKSADFELLKAILTYYIRQERFGDGLWATAANEKIFLGILYRLKKLTAPEK